MGESAFGLELNFTKIKLYIRLLFEKFQITLIFFDKKCSPTSPVFLKFMSLRAVTVTMKVSHF